MFDLEPKNIKAKIRQQSLTKVFYGVDFWFEYFNYCVGMALLHKPICKGFFSDIIFK